MTSAKVTAGDINGKLQIISGRIIMTFILSNEEHELEFCQNQMLDRLKAYIILLQIMLLYQASPLNKIYRIKFSSQKDR